MRAAKADGSDVVVARHIGEERHGFGSAAEAEGRAAFVAEALSWLGTPFNDCSDIKGPNGCVDCAMLLVACAKAAGRVPESFDPRPYAPRHMLHRSEELFLGIVLSLGAVEVTEPKVGDIVLWQFGRCFSHGAVLITSAEVCHAYGAAGKVVISERHEPLLDFILDAIPRPVRYFDLWAGR